MQDQVWISIDDYVIQTYQGWYNIRTVINNATLNLTKETRKEIPRTDLLQNPCYRYKGNGPLNFYLG